MAALTNPDRFEVWAEIMRDQGLGTCAINKTDLGAAVDAIDDFLVANASTINNAFPAAAQAGLTTPQKAMVVSYVALKRWVKGA